MRLSAGGGTPVRTMSRAEHTAPRFAERAVEMLERGQVAAALSLCLGGTAQYPGYATGHWVLGRCYEMLGKPREAAGQFQRVDELLPGVEGVAEALRRVTGTGIDAGSAPAGGAESGIEFLLRQLQSAKQRGNLSAAPLQPVENQSADAVAGSAGDRGEIGGADREERSSIVTATLAEIYAQQGEYGEAVAAYRRLIQQRPDEAGRYGERLAALERLLQGVDKSGEA